MDENQLIQKINSATDALSFRARGGVVGVGDDAALWKPQSGMETILTCDWFLEGTHFLLNTHPPDAVGWKCLARAVSDIAAMGGTPVCYLLSLTLPPRLTGRWLHQVLVGLRRAAKAFRCPLAGGDTTNKEDVVISITVVGEVAAGRAVLRSGAKPGDLVFVSGRLGEAELGLRLVRGASKPNRLNRATLRDSFVKKHLYPEPRLSLGAWLARHRLASAMMDLSDGLSTDLPRLCARSGVGARVDASKLPKPQLSPRLKNSSPDPLQSALHGGDDYELLFAVSPSRKHLVPAAYRGLALTRIGEITENQNVLVREEGRLHPLANRGWDPFRQRSAKHRG